MCRFCFVNFFVSIIRLFCFCFFCLCVRLICLFCLPVVFGRFFSLSLIFAFFFLFYKPLFCFFSSVRFRLFRRMVSRASEWSTPAITRGLPGGTTSCEGPCRWSRSPRLVILILTSLIVFVFFAQHGACMSSILTVYLENIYAKYLVCIYIHMNIRSIHYFCTAWCIYVVNSCSIPRIKNILRICIRRAKYYFGAAWRISVVNPIVFLELND